MYRIDKSALLLIMNLAVLTIKNCLMLILQDKRKCEHFLSYSKCSKCLPTVLMYSLNLFLKLEIAL